MEQLQGFEEDVHKLSGQILEMKLTPRTSSPDMVKITDLTDQLEIKEDTIV